MRTDFTTAPHARALRIGRRAAPWKSLRGPAHKKTDTPVVEDAYGRDFALKYKDTSVIIFPLTMISKRIERGETVDVFDLYNGVANQVQEILSETPDKL